MEITIWEQSPLQLHIDWPEFQRKCRFDFYSKDDLENWFIYLHSLCDKVEKKIDPHESEKHTHLYFVNSGKTYKYWRETFIRELEFPNYKFDMIKTRVKIHEKNFKISFKLLQDKTPEGIQKVYDVSLDIIHKPFKIYFSDQLLALYWFEKNLELDKNVSMKKFNTLVEIGFSNELIYRDWQRQMLKQVRDEKLFFHRVKTKNKNYYFFFTSNKEEKEWIKNNTFFLNHLQ